MNIGLLGSYRLPASIRNAYGVSTAQELADQLGVTKKPTLALSGEAEAAYAALKAGNTAPARSLLVDKLGVSTENADAALARVPKL
jgi:hypothetical protein